MCSGYKLYLLLWFLCVSCFNLHTLYCNSGEQLNTCEILTGGELLMNWQRRSTFEPTNPDFPSSISTVWPFIPGGETQEVKKKKILSSTFTHADGHEYTHKYAHVGSITLACSKLFTISTACWADKVSWAVKGDTFQQRERWAEVKGFGLEWDINKHDLFGYCSHWLTDPL